MPKTARARGWEQPALGGIVTVLLAAAVYELVTLRRLEDIRHTVVATHERTLQVARELERLAGSAERSARFVRSFLLASESWQLEELSQARQQFDDALRALRHLEVQPELAALLDNLEQLTRQTRDVADSLILARQRGATVDTIHERYEQELVPVRQKLDGALASLSAAVHADLRHRFSTGERLLNEGTARMQLSTVAGTLVLVALGVLAARSFRGLARSQGLLERRLAEFDAVLESLPVPVFVADLEQLRAANPPALALLGLQRLSDLQGGARAALERLALRDARSGALVPPEQTALFRALSGSAASQEAVLAPSAGSGPRDLRLVAAPVREQGQPVAAAVVALEVTEQMERERALRLSEAKLTGVVTLAHDPVICVDEACRIQLFNRGAERVFGHRAAELLGHPLHLLLPERLREEARRRFEDFLALGGVSRDIPAGGPLLWLRKSGEEFPAEGSISRLEVDGEVVTTLLLRDVTGQVRTQREQHFLASASSLLAESLDPEVTLERIAALAVPELGDGCTVFVAEDERLRGVAAAHAEPAAAEALREALSRTSLPLTSAHGMAQAVRTGEAQLWSDIPDTLLAELAVDSELYRVLRQWGCSAMLTLPLRARGTALGALVLVQCTPRRRFEPRERALAEEMARRAALAIDNAGLYAAAQRATAARDEVLSVVAHDLRNPLNSISLCEGSLRSRLGRQGPVPDELVRPLDTIQAAARRAGRLIQDLLDIARLESGRFGVDRRHCVPWELLHDALEVQRPLAEQAELELKLDVRSELPDIEADPGRLLQVFTNLVENAAKFTPRGGVVALGGARRDAEVLFWVSDSGTGIPPEQLPHLFERFWQGSARDRRGAGLGLAICRGIVEAHGGRIWAQSSPGAGSTFFFTLPALDESLPRRT